MSNSAIAIKNLSKTYKNGVKAVKGIDLTIPQGDFFALLGPNGAGKTTIIGMISTLINKTTGTIAIMGHDLEREPALAKSKLGVVPQEINLHGFDTVLSVLLNQAAFYGIPRKIAKERAQELLRQMDLWGKHKNRVLELSGGMKRRVMIARALIHHPEVLLLDEPTAGVDIEIRHEMWRYLTKLNQAGLTIILTTHYLEEAEQLCKNIAIIDHGELVINTTMEQLLASLDKEVVILYLENQKTMEVELKKGESITDLLLGLKKEGIIVERIRNKTNRLEQLFINLVREKC